jgi:hypothetical protein
VYAELAGSDPGGLRYATFRLADGVSFIHIAVIDDENPLERSSAFAAFQRQLADRVIDPPAAVGATLVGSYRFLTESGSTGT